MNETLQQFDLTKGEAGMANGDGVRIGWGALITVLVVILTGVIGYNFSIDRDTTVKVDLMQREKLDRSEYAANHLALETDMKVWIKEIAVSIKELNILLSTHMEKDRDKR
jgi:hypothetical protein